MEGAVWKDQLSGRRGGKMASHRRLPPEHRSPEKSLFQVQNFCGVRIEKNQDSHQSCGFMTARRGTSRLSGRDKAGAARVER